MQIKAIAGKNNKTSCGGLSCRTWSETFEKKDPYYAYKGWIYIPWANISQTWQSTTHHAIQRGSSHPYAKGGSVNQETRQRSDACSY